MTNMRRTGPFIERKASRFWDYGIEFFFLLFNLYFTICPAGHLINFSSLIGNQMARMWIKRSKHEISTQSIFNILFTVICINIIIYNFDRRKQVYLDIFLQQI